MTETPPAPTIPYWHLYTDESGTSRFKQCVMREFELKGVTAGVDPQWLGPKHHDGMTVILTVQPVGWVGDWHENPAPQWIIPLKGKWFVEAMDGTRVEMGPGDISFGEDQRTTAQGSKKGHLSGTVGEEPAVLMIVQFDTVRDDTTPCRFP